MWFGKNLNPLPTAEVLLKVLRCLFPCRPTLWTQLFFFQLRSYWKKKSEKYIYILCHKKLSRLFQERLELLLHQIFLIVIATTQFPLQGIWLAEPKILIKQRSIHPFLIYIFWRSSFVLPRTTLSKLLMDGFVELIGEIKQKCFTWCQLFHFCHN